MRNRLTALPLALLLVLAACDREEPTSTPPEGHNPPISFKQQASTPISQQTTVTINGVTQDAVVTVTGFAFDQARTTLLVALAARDLERNPLVTLPRLEASLEIRQGGGCRILELDFGPLDLTLLGLVVQLPEINIDIVAHSGGTENLLGNLLCSLGRLLAETPLDAAEILDMIQRINQLLA